MAGERVPGSTRNALIAAVVIGFAAVALVFLRSLVVLPWVEHANAWVIPLDTWTPVRAARYVANGDVFHLYEPLAGRTGYPYTPGLPVLLAPFVGIGDHFHALGDVFFPHRHPGMFLYVGPADALLGTVPVVFAAGAAAGGTRRQQWKVESFIFLVAAWAPLGFFHPEDSIVTALLIGSCLAIEHDSWRSAGALAGVGLLFKQWAAWPAIICVALAPRSKRAQSAFYAYGVPALVLVPFFLASPNTWTSLTGTLATLRFGQAQLWTSFAFGHSTLANATTLRVFWGLGSLAIAIRARHDRSCDSALAAMSVVMLARLAVEPMLFGYYLVPAATLALVWCARNDERFGLRALVASLLCAFCIPHVLPQVVFFAVLIGGLSYVCGPAVHAWWTAGRSAERRVANRDIGALPV